jgi:hypothetical protein
MKKMMITMMMENKKIRRRLKKTKIQNQNLNQNQRVRINKRLNLNKSPNVNSNDCELRY